MNKRAFSKRAFATVAVATLVALVCAPASAKTKAECTREWQADKAANQAAHITEKAYVTECRGTAAVKPASGGAQPN